MKAYQESNHLHRATLIRSTFDDARTKVLPNTIDILHIDGLHTYDAVRNDFETWLDTLTDRGIILLHDIAVRHSDFGVWRLWQELSAQYPEFEFLHCNGLGVLAVGDKIPGQAQKLFELSTEEADRVRNIYMRIGQSIVDWKAEALAAKKRLDDIEGSRSWRLAEFISGLHVQFRRRFAM